MSDIEKAFSIFQNNINEGRNTIVVNMIIEGINASKAMRLYTKFARQAGLIISPADKKKKVMASLDSLDISTVESYNETLNSLVREFTNLSKSTIKRYIKDFAKTNDILLPEVIGRNKKMNAALLLISKEDIESKSRESIMEILRSEDVGYTELTASGTYNRLRKKYELEKIEAKSVKLAKWFVENTNVSNQEILTKGEELGLAEASVRYYIRIFNTALMIAKRLVEDK